VILFTVCFRLGNAASGELDVRDKKSSQKNRAQITTDDACPLHLAAMLHVPFRISEQRRNKRMMDKSINIEKTKKICADDLAVGIGLG
jgi:hypothetical protein